MSEFENEELEAYLANIDDKLHDIKNALIIIAKSMQALAYHKYGARIDLNYHLPEEKKKVEV